MNKFLSLFFYIFLFSIIHTQATDIGLGSNLSQLPQGYCKELNAVVMPKGSNYDATYPAVAIIKGTSVLALTTNLYNDLIPFLKKSYDLIKEGKYPTRDELKLGIYKLILHYGIPLYLAQIFIDDLLKNLYLDIPRYTSTSARFLLTLKPIIGNLLIWYGPRLVLPAVQTLHSGLTRLGIQ